ncbi:EutN/CcmL family microcompartment protein [Amycolatopsis rhabdoformis]|uniref:EutN/CcmL family microcompartment protein n=1 Tax=Amycolatopsis rhabdoformis TaxID=1448059 RepID=A0ABZ1II90_9PSEU|nr:EutN/CcmL family microcompartment protein [Amycolatopsis rhabdoformis]WSE34170.1 EutN/CcmL family microcompartment protein [Amycolatopsis rhabdoformis]
MILGRVIGRVWSDRQLLGMATRRFVLVRSVGDDTVTVAVDLLDASPGTTVLVTTDEAAAAASGEATVDAAVVALVSDYDEPSDRTPDERTLR